MITNALESVDSLSGEDISIINSHDHTYISNVGQIYLVGKLLGESMPLKTILSKCLSDCKVTGEVNVVDMGNGFTFVKFTNSIDCTRFLKGNHSLWG